MASLDRSTADQHLRALGELLGAGGHRIAIVVVGGVALALGEHVDRTTQDVDVLAVIGDDGVPSPANPLPQALADAAARVARDHGLPADWLNGVIGSQVPHGLPPDLERDLEWRDYGGLRVGIAGRIALVALKLYAAADQSAGSKHVADSSRSHRAWWSGSASSRGSCRRTSPRSSSGSSWRS